MQQNAASTGDDMNTQVVADFLKNKKKFSRKTVLVIVLIFAALGAFLLWRSFALSNVVLKAEVENINVPALSSDPHQSAILSTPFTNTSSPDYLVMKGYVASNNNVYKFSWEGTDAKGGSLNGAVTRGGTIDLPSGVTSLSVRAVGKACGSNNKLPYLSLSIDDHAVFPSNAGAGGKPWVHMSTSWTDYPVNYTIPSGAHNIKISGNNLGAKNSSYCSSPLYADVITFYGPSDSIPAPAPTPVPGITFTASPNPINAGQSTTLTWSATNADYCLANGGPWGTAPNNDSSNQKTANGTYSTGALSATSTYGIKCHGAGGDSTSSVTVSINAAGYIPHSPGSGNPNLIVGVVSGWYGDSTPGYIKAAVDYTRLDAVSNFPPASGVPTYVNASTWRNKGVKIDLLFPGGTNGLYNTGGVAAIADTDAKRTAWANYALSTYQRLGCDPVECPMIEVLNEPGGYWFWGQYALTNSANWDAYAKLVDKAYTTFHGVYGDSAPKILATFDGTYTASGSWGVNTWGHNWWPKMTDTSHVDGIIVHPYGGTSGTFDNQNSANGNWSSVRDAHNTTHKSIYVTEVGWPTAVGHPNTGDSFQWPEDKQAYNIYNFVDWARNEKDSSNNYYINSVMIFNYRDYTTSNGVYAWYGITRGKNNPSGPEGSFKPSYYSLQCAALNKSWSMDSYTTCGP